MEMMEGTTEVIMSSYEGTHWAHTREEQWTGPREYRERGIG